MMTYRLEQADESLKIARTLLEQGLYETKKADKSTS